MPIIEQAIATEVISLTQQLNGGPSSDPSTEQAFADGLATIIANAIKSATITIPAGTIITAGSAATQTQSVPGVVNDGIS